MSCFLGALIYAQEITAEEKLLLEKLNNDYAADKKSASLNYAWLLYRSGGECPKADTVLNLVISQQDDDPESSTYGHWGWVWRNGEKFVDWNNALFQSHVLFCDLWTQQDKMSPATRAGFISCCKRVVEAAKRRWDHEVFDIYRDFTAYSNVFAMYIQTFFLAADRFNDARLEKMAKGQWTRWYNHISFFGIDEFASPGYNWVIFRALKDIGVCCQDARIRKETKEVMDHLPFTIGADPPRFEAARNRDQP